MPFLLGYFVIMQTKIGDNKFLINLYNVLFL